MSGSARGEHPPRVSSNVDGVALSGDWTTLGLAGLTRDIEAALAARASPAAVACARRVGAALIRRFGVTTRRLHPSTWA